MTHHLVGAAEVAAILGVTRQRVAQLSVSDLTFPQPEVELSAGRIWSREAIERWTAEHRERGTRSKATSVPAAGDWPPTVRAVMDLAGAVAKELNHSWLGPDHVLLALLHPESPGAARKVLESFGLRFEETRDAFVASMGDPFDPHQRGQTVPPATQLLLEAAKRKAVELRDEAVGSEHVLLALTERWERGPLTCQLAQRGVEGEELLRRTLIVTEAAGEGENDWPLMSLLPWPGFDDEARRSRLELATSPSGHDPWRRRDWGSIMFVDGAGKMFHRGKAVRQYFIDRDGHPVLTADGRPIHVLVDEDGNALRDQDGSPRFGPVEIPPGCSVVPARGCG